MFATLFNAISARLFQVLASGIDFAPHCHHFSSHGGGPSDPALDAIVQVVFASMAILALGTTAVSLIGGPLLFLLSGRITRLLWALPGTNLLLYVLVILLRPYPGGFSAQFHPPGLIYTLVEIVGLVLWTLLLLVIVVLGTLLFRAIRSLRRQWATDQQQGQGETFVQVAHAANKDD